MPSTTKHRWTFTARFRRHAFGWRSQPAIIRIREAVSEIKKAARKDPILGAEGAFKFLEKVSPGPCACGQLFPKEKREDLPSKHLSKQAIRKRSDVMESAFAILASFSDQEMGMGVEVL